MLMKSWDVLLAEYQCIGLLEMGEIGALLDLRDNKVKTHMKKKIGSLDHGDKGANKHDFPKGSP